MGNGLTILKGFVGLAGALEYIIETVDDFLGTLLDVPIAGIFMAVIAVIIVLAEKRTVIQ